MVFVEQLREREKLKPMRSVAVKRRTIARHVHAVLDEFTWRLHSTELSTSQKHIKVALHAPRHLREETPARRETSVGACVRAGVDLGTRSTFADVAQTLAEVFGLGRLPHGTSFLPEITA